KYTFHKGTNDNGERLVSLCETSEFISAITRFKHPIRRQYTWSPERDDISIRTQIDHILVRCKWANSLKNCRAYSTVEVNSDHRIMTANFTLSLKCNGKNQNTTPHKCYSWDSVTASTNSKILFATTVSNR